MWSTKYICILIFTYLTSIRKLGLMPALLCEMTFFHIQQKLSWYRVPEEYNMNSAFLKLCYS